MAILIEIKCSSPKISMKVGEKFANIVREENDLLIKKGEKPIELKICKALGTSCNLKIVPSHKII